MNSYKTLYNFNEYIHNAKNIITSVFNNRVSTTKIISKLKYVIF
jgi:hypothetical protein